jgi:hypothetical protein
MKHFNNHKFEKEVPFVLDADITRDKVHTAVAHSGVRSLQCPE